MTRQQLTLILPSKMAAQGALQLGLNSICCCWGHEGCQLVLLYPHVTLHSQDSSISNRLLAVEVSVLSSSKAQEACCPEWPLTR